MRIQISAICVVLTLGAAMVVAQSSQRDTPSTTSIPTPTATGTTPTTTAACCDPRIGDDHDNATAY